MGKDLWENSSSVKKLFELASDTTGIDCSNLLFHGTEEELKKTDNTQVAITLVNLAAAEALQEKGITPDGCAGFSLGEFSALVTAGVLTREDVFPLVKERGLFMEAASRKLDKSGGCGMAAVVGTSVEKVEEAIQSIEDVYIANLNSPVQTVISGTITGLDKAEQACKSAGARRVIRLKVSGPFHSPLLKEAQDEFAQYLKTINFTVPQIPLYSNVLGRKVEQEDDLKQLSIDQITSPVRWVDEENAMITDGVQRCIEAGPGKVLCGLWKSVSRDIPCLQAGTMDSVENIE